MIYRCEIELYPFSGPSYTLDAACSSSMYAIEHAYRAMRGGLCDSAIVGGSNVCLHPYMSLNFSRLGVLSLQGICRSFDRDGKHLSSVRCDMYILIIMIWCKLGVVVCVLAGCRLKVLQNIVLLRILGPNSKEVIGFW